MGEVVGFGAGGDGGFAEGVVFVVGDEGAGAVEVFGNISVAVVSWEVGTGAVGHGEEAADSACALQSAAEIHAPEIRILNGECCILNGVFGDGVPAVVNGDFCGGADGFGDAAGLGVVGISDDRAGRPYRGLDQSVFAVPYQCAVRVDVGGERAACHVAVGIKLGIDY